MKLATSTLWLTLAVTTSLLLFGCASSREDDGYPPKPTKPAKLPLRVPADPNRKRPHISTG